MRPAPRRLAALLLFPALLLAACGGSTSSAAKSPTSSASGSASPSGAKATTKSGIVVTGGFGQKPTLTIPATAEPTALVVEPLVQGKGPVVNKGDMLVINYLGQTWKPDNGKVNVFDNSYDRGQPASFAIGEGQLIEGWDQGLVGQKAGSRVVMSIPAKLAYHDKKQASNALYMKSLVFVVDVLGSVPQTATATGTPVTGLPAGLPQVDSRSGKQPVITSVAGVKAPAKGAAAVSALVLKGDGAPIDSKKNLAVQLVQTDVATGKKSTKTWDGGGGPQFVPAEQVVTTIPALKGATVGSRAVLVTPPSDQNPALAVVVDIVAQF